MKIDTVIFDFGGVLSLTPNNETIQRMNRLCGLDRDSFEQAYLKHRADFDRGGIDGLTYWSRVLEAGTLEPDGKPKTLLAMDIESWTNIDRRMVALNERLRESGYKTAILSNMPRETLAYIYSEMEWIRNFDATVFSCEHGLIKPDQEIYLLCLDALQAAPGQALFLDDSPQNTAAAGLLGINILTYTTYSQARKALQTGYGFPAHLF